MESNGHIRKAGSYGDITAPYPTKIRHKTYRNSLFPGIVIHIIIKWIYIAI
jgi:hypothetical protein